MNPVESYFRALKTRFRSLKNQMIGKNRRPKIVDLVKEASLAIRKETT